MDPSGLAGPLVLLRSAAAMAVSARQGRRERRHLAGWNVAGCRSRVKATGLGRPSRSSHIPSIPVSWFADVFIPLQTHESNLRVTPSSINRTARAAAR